MKPDPPPADDDNPDLTSKDFARARPFKEVFTSSFGCNRKAGAAGRGLSGRRCVSGSAWRPR